MPDIEDGGVKARLETRQHLSSNLFKRPLFSYNLQISVILFISEQYTTE